MTSTRPAHALRPVAEEPRISGSKPFAFAFPTDFRPVVEGAGVCLFVSVAVAWYLKLWTAYFRLPWSYDSDGPSTLETTKDILSTGWNLHNPRVGAPFVASRVDFPHGGESVHWLSLKLLGYVLRSAVLTNNVYLLLSYLLVALAAFYVARYLGLGRGPAFLVGVLYTFLPYHQARGAIDLARSAYYIAPLVVLVILWVVCYRTELHQPAASGVGRVRPGRVAFAVLVCAVQGLSDTQISGFAICILVIVGLVVAASQRDVRPMGWALLCAGTIAITLLVANTPYLVARLTQGPNLIAAHRTLLDQEIWGLRLALMLLPVEGHRIGFLAHLTTKAHTGEFVGTEGGQAIGVIGAIGFLAATIANLGKGWRQSLQAEPESPARKALSILGGICLVAVVLGEVGGLSYLIAMGGLTLLRTWDRIVVIIGFVSLLACGVLLHEAERRSGARRRQFERRPTTVVWLPSAIAVLAMVCVGVADQASPTQVPNYAAIAHNYDIDADFFGSLEAAVPARSMIFQYPVTPYPEALPVNQLQSYGEFVGYLHTKTLRWSYGAMSGRAQGDWQTGTFDNLPVPTATAALSAIGFRGIWVGRDGYFDHGVFFESQLRSLLGSPLLVSADQRMAYYDLAPESRRIGAALTSQQRQAFAAAVLSATTETFGTGFYPAESDGTITWHWGQRQARLNLTNSSNHTENVVLTANLASNGPGRVLVAGGGVNKSVAIAKRDAAPLDVPLRLPRGTTTITFTAAVPGPIVAPLDNRSLWLRIADIEVAPVAVHDALCRFEQGVTRPLDCE